MQSKITAHLNSKGDDMELDKLVNGLVSDQEIPSEIKLEMLSDWEDRTIDSRANTIMSKVQLEQHVAELEIFHNAKETLKITP